MAPPTAARIIPYKSADWQEFDGGTFLVVVIEGAKSHTASINGEFDNSILANPKTKCMVLIGHTKRKQLVFSLKNKLWVRACQHEVHGCAKVVVGGRSRSSVYGHSRRRMALKPFFGEYMHYVIQ